MNHSKQELLNIISSLKGDLKKKDGKLLGMMKQLKMVPPKLRRRAIKGEVVSAGLGAISQLKEIGHYVRCIETINHDGCCGAIAPILTRRIAVFKAHKNAAGVCLCIHCNAELPFDIMTVDHLKPQSKGGGDEMDNLAPSCKSCNELRPCADISCPVEPESFLIL